MTETIPEDLMQAAAAVVNAAEEECRKERYLFGFPTVHGKETLDKHIARALMAQRTRQEERVRVLEEALRPFADQASTFDSCGKEFVPDRFEPAIVDHTIGDLRRARAALGNGGGDA